MIRYRVETRTQMYVRYDLERDETWMALIWVQGGTEMLFWNFDRSDLSPGWRWGEIIETWRDMNVSPPSRSRLTFMRVPKTASRVHPGPIWNPSRYHYVCHVCHRYFHSCPASPASMSPPPPPPPPPLHAPFHIHPCPEILQFMLQPGHDVGISHPSISCLTCIQVKRIAPQLILVPLLHIQVSRCVSQPNPGPTALPRLNICIPSPPRSRLTQFR